MQLADLVVYSSLVWLPCVIYLWYKLLKVVIPNIGSTIEEKAKEGAKALLATAKEDMVEELGVLKADFEGIIGGISSNMKEEITAVSADVKEEMGRITETVGLKVEATVAEVKEGIAAEITQTIDGMYDNISEIATLYMKRFSDPTDMEIARLCNDAVSRAWVILIESPEFQNRIKGFLDRKVDYVVDHFIKRMKEDPEFRKEIVGLVKPMAAEAGFDFNDPMAMITGMFGGGK